MNDAKVAEFTARYMSMHEEDLAQLRSKRETLTEEAQTALNIVLAERNIDFASLQEAEKQEAIDFSKKFQETENRKEKRHFKYAKILFAIFIPIALLGVIFNPERSYSIFISSLVQAILLGVIYILIVAVRRAIARKRKQ